MACIIFKENHWRVQGMWVYHRLKSSSILLCKIHGKSNKNEAYNAFFVVSQSDVVTLSQVFQNHTKFCISSPKNSS